MVRQPVSYGEKHWEAALPVLPVVREGSAAYPVSDTAPFPIRMVNGAEQDAFGRLRVSNTATVFDASQEYSYHPLMFEHVTAGTGAATHSTARNSTVLTTGGVASVASAVDFTEVY